MHTHAGQFVDGRKHGKGVYKSSNGNTYDGMFDNDKRHGEGCTYYHDGDWFSGSKCFGLVG